MNVMVVFDVVITLFGLYMVISSFKMKKTGVISSTVVSKQEIMNCKKPEEFIQFMYWKEAIFGAVIMIVGSFKYQKVFTYLSHSFFILESEEREQEKMSYGENFSCR